MSQSVSHDKGTFALISGWENDVYLSTIDSKSGKLVNRIKKTVSSWKKFVADIPKLLKKNVKAVILNVFNLKPTSFSNFYEFHKAIKTKLDRMRVPYVFLSECQDFCSSTLIANNVKVEFSETVLIILINEYGINVTELTYTINGYATAMRKFAFDPNESHKSIRQKIIATSTPKTIIISQNIPGYPVAESIKQILSFEDLTITDYNIIQYETEFISEMAKYILDKSCTKFWVIPSDQFGYSIHFRTGGRDFNLFNSLGDDKESLPTKQELIVPKYSFNLTLYAARYKESIETFTLPLDCHQVKLTLSLDSNNFPSYEAVPVMIPKIERLPVHLDSFVPSKTPVIGFFANYSVICHHKDGHYQFLDKWNGVYGRELLISFATKKPKFAEAAVEALRTKPSCVVLDLMTIMSTPLNKIEQNHPYGLRFTQNAENPLLIEFNKDDGSIGAASPAFLMAMLIKKHLSAIRDEIGEKPDSIAIYIFNDYEVEERRRVEEQLQEACKMLKIDLLFV
uniref:Uncharacterized protein n=1 Tax=Panagrolaimus superbus TaxID=310955 RepID=A0A914Z8W5_9BILA